jgi:sulfatase modifying factor 1
MCSRLSRAVVWIPVILLSGLAVGTRAVRAADEAKAGPVKVNPKDGLKYVWIPPGNFDMGCSPGDNQCFSDEKPRHHVIISKGFWLGQTPVTVAAYKKYIEATGGRMPRSQPFNADWKNEQNPIVDVAYANGVAYSKWMGGRLPTEAEWEYAARAGSNEARYGPLDEIAWYGDNSGQQHVDSTKLWALPERHNYLMKMFQNKNGTHDVAQKRPNAFGLYDMLGNVYQYTSDFYRENYYASSPDGDPKGPPSPDPLMSYVLRGGAWADQPNKVRASYRDGHLQGFQIGIDGFRCVWEQPAP